ncbi:MAG: DUF2283 domain-containing protein [Chloroherpetonaceae bacterium]|nr:DUF2283 domain-containing protein [Chloroherpetonaceae bacterium]MDW8437914.1 DUF2283 domain-containing protein [Chloroherpetonaceae bacterium]
MKIEYDAEIDAAYIRMSDKQPLGVIEIAEGIAIDIGENDALIGIEILDASKRFPLETLFRFELDRSLIAKF